MPGSITRRKLMLAGALATVGLSLPSRGRAAGDPISILWDELLPGEGKTVLDMDALRDQGVTETGAYNLPFRQEEADAVITDFNGKIIKIPGFCVPLDYTREGITVFVLVPYHGACIHVPPPPANQIVYVTPKEPWIPASMWDPIYATGLFNTSAVSTELAEIGYEMTDAEIELYPWD